jgi:hypothetical protein
MVLPWLDRSLLVKRKRKGRRRRNPWFADLRKVVADDTARRGPLPALSLSQILAWADAHFDRTGDWPYADSGPIRGSGGESWIAIEAALSLGLRELPDDWTLARLLAEYRGKRNTSDLPHLSIEEILHWSDAYHALHGEWPIRNAVAIPEAPGETWAAVDAALCDGRRGLPGDSSLARLLMQHRGKRNHLARPRLSVGRILDLKQA